MELFMQDCSACDPRSFKAWLNGLGDKRVKKFERFSKRMLRKHPSMDDLELGDRYAKALDFERRVQREVLPPLTRAIVWLGVTLGALEMFLRVS